MVTTLFKRIIFYRHFLYGSAILIGTLIGTNFTSGGWPGVMMYTAAGMFMASSAIVTYTINKYPEEFEEEIDEYTRLKDSRSE